MFPLHFFLSIKSFFSFLPSLMTLLTELNAGPGMIFRSWCCRVSKKDKIINHACISHRTKPSSSSEGIKKDHSHLVLKIGHSQWVHYPARAVFPKISLQWPKMRKMLRKRLMVCPSYSLWFTEMHHTAQNTFFFPKKQQLPDPGYLNPPQQGSLNNKYEIKQRHGQFISQYILAAS